MRRMVDVAVNFTLYPDGTIVPKYMEWEDGDKYEIQKFECKGKRACDLGRNGILFECAINGMKRDLYFEDWHFKWFLVAER